MYYLNNIRKIVKQRPRIFFSLSLLIFFSLNIYFALQRYRTFRHLILNDELANTNCLCNSEDYCNLGQIYQFKNFIWVVTDGFGRKYAKDSLQFYKDHSIQYDVVVPSYKFSHAIYTSWLTGQQAFNYQGQPIGLHTDHIFQSFARNTGTCSSTGSFISNRTKDDPKPISYIGPIWSFLYIAGMGLKGLSGEHPLYEVHDTPEDDSHMLPYHYFFPDETTLPSIFTSLSEKKQSLVLHSGIWDKNQHYFKGSIPDFYIYLRHEAVFINKFLSRFKSFIDANPDYLLILSSDHGVDNLETHHLHGDGTNGNIGYLMFYSPIFEEYNGGEIDVVDVAPTISKYLNNVDIPMHTVGYPRNQYGSGNTHVKFYTRALKQSLYQLSNEAIHQHHHIDQKKFSSLLESDNLEEIKQETIRLKDLLFSGDQSFPFLPLIFLVFSVLLSQGYVLFCHFIGFDGSLFPVIKSVLWLFVLFSPMYLHLLFASYVFGKYFQAGYTFMAIHFFSLFATIIIRHKYINHLVIVESISILSFILIRATEKYLYLHYIFSPISWIMFCFIVYKLQRSKIEKVSLYLFCLCSFLFYLSSNVTWLYFAGIHIFAFLVFDISILLLIYYVYNGQPIRMIFSFCYLFQFMSFGSLILCLLLVQFLILSPFSKIFSKENINKNENSASLELISTLCYIISFPLFCHVFMIKQGVGAHVDPTAGVVGIISWNLYPTFCSFLMFFSNFGLFLICNLFASSIAPTSSFYLANAIYTIKNSISLIGFYLSFYFYSIKHIPEDALVLSFLYFVAVFLTQFTWGYDNSDIFSVPDLASFFPVSITYIFPKSIFRISRLVQTKSSLQV